MSADLDIHPFSPASVAFEGGAPSRRETIWLRWIAKAERLIGHDLDGNDAGFAGCGYSMDEALIAFEGGNTADSYVAMVTRRARYSRPGDAS